MELFLGFAPFIAFVFVANHVSPNLALLVGAFVAVGLVVRTYVRRPGTFRVLEVGTAVLMSALAAFTMLGGQEPSLIATRLWVDAGLLLVVLASMLMGTPFTIQYARDKVDPKYWDSEVFIRKNYKITGAWAGAFATLVCIEGAMLLFPDIPQHFGYLLIIAVLLVAFRYTATASKTEVNPST